MIRAFEVAYDGTDYAGWQIQDNARTIQGVIEDALKRVLKQRVRIAYAGRTDAGVHALGQVISFETESGMTGEQFVRALNALLPTQIRIMRQLSVADGFHPRYSASSRWYRYIIWNGEELVPFFRNYALWLNRRIDLERLRAYSRRIIGEHDFTSFATVRNGETPIRRVMRCEVHRMNDFIVFDIEANSYLRKMVRTLVGTFLSLEYRNGPPERIDAMLEAKDREAGGETAFAGGLYLARVFYDSRRGTV
jgi:tRNA pseudouridine38-40 synthase